MLVGRQLETARLEALLAAARSGRAAALVLRGAPGIGKTALIDETVRRAADFQVLGASGFESDAELPWAGLHHLLRPTLGRVDELPHPQAAALRAALAMGGGETDRFAVFAGALGLLALIAEDAPLLCVVDDAHWLDAASAEALVFSARRLDADRVAMLFAARVDEGAFVAPGLRRLDVARLEDDDAVALLATGGRTLAPATVCTVLRLAAGNPLALRELPAALTDDQRDGRAPVDDPVTVGDRLERAFAAQVERLSLRGRRAVLLAAAAGQDGLGDLLDVPAVAAGLAEAERAGLLGVSVDGVVFRHPLIRAAAYQTATRRARRAAHARLAESLDDDAADARSWHRALASAGPDEGIARELEAVGDRAAGRGSMSTRARALELAARLTSGKPGRARRLAAASAAAFLAGHRPTAIRLVDEAATLATDAVTRAGVTTVRWDVESDRAEELYPQLVVDAHAVATLDPVCAARMLMYAGGYKLYSWLPAEAGPLIERGWNLIDGRPSAALPGAMITLGGLRLAEQSFEDAAELAFEGLKLARDTGSWDDPDALAGGAGILIRLEHPAARAAIEELVERARGGESSLALAAALCALSDLELAEGRLPAAYRAAGEGLAVAELFAGWRTAFAAAQLALCEAWLGSTPACVQHCRQALAHAGRNDHRTLARLQRARGVVALGAGEPARALQEFERMLRSAPSPEHHGAVDAELECVEALFRSGRPHDGTARLQALEERLEHAWLPAARRAALRCRLFAASDEGLDGAFAAAFGGGTAGMPLESARTRLIYGERLRRAGRRSDARGQLRLAEAEFEELGATAWVVRTRRELRASGATLARRGALAASELTPQERQIALAVAEGMTNREIAAAFFISPKTVEQHLSRVFRKLGISSRRDLVRAHRSPLLDWQDALGNTPFRTTTQA